MFASGSPFPPAIGLFGRAFGARSRIRIRDMIGRWLIVAMAWITSVGAGWPQLLHRLDEGGARSWANGVWKAARSLRELTNPGIGHRGASVGFDRHCICLAPRFRPDDFRC